MAELASMSSWCSSGNAATIGLTPTFFVPWTVTAGDNSLDFCEVLTLYYIMKTRGVCCQNCGVWLSGLYFTCVSCFDIAPNTYDLCARCYVARRFCHHHTSFLDNYVLLRSKRGLPPGQANLSLVIN
jgi:hypothetical protein